MKNNDKRRACAACSFRRQKCDENCVLAPYFPRDQEQQFKNAWKVFGAKNIINLINAIELESDRDDAVAAIKECAANRVQDPVGGCTRIMRELRLQIAGHEDEFLFLVAHLANVGAPIDHHYPALNEAQQHTYQLLDELGPDQAQERARLHQTVLLYRQLMDYALAQHQQRAQHEAQQQTQAQELARSQLEEQQQAQAQVLAHFDHQLQAQEQALNHQVLPSDQVIAISTDDEDDHQRPTSPIDH